MSRPQLWLLTGGNGAGMSTFYQRFLASKGLPFVNADLIAKRLDPHNAEALSYQAALLATHSRQELLSQQVSFCFETVFSHPSKVDFAAEALAHGYTLILIYIHLDSAMLNQARVAQRVSEGGPQRTATEDHRAHPAHPYEPQGSTAPGPARTPLRQLQPGAPLPRRGRGGRGEGASTGRADAGMALQPLPMGCGLNTLLLPRRGVEQG